MIRGSSHPSIAGKRSDVALADCDSPAESGLALAEHAASWRGLVVLLVVAFVAYLPALRGGFLWDDDFYVEQNQALRSLDGLIAIWLDPSATPQYYPLVHSSYWLEYQLFGLNPTPYHATNIALHALSAWLLIRLLRQAGIPGGALAGVLFALHPVAVESVAWITERKNTLSTAFYLLAALSYWPIVRADAANGALTWSRTLRMHYAAALGCYVAALLSKTVTCSLPAALLLLVYYRRGRVAWRDAARLAPFFLIGLILAWNTARLEREQVGAVGPAFDLSLLARVAVAGRALWFYLGKIVWPYPLIFFYERWKIDPPGATDLLYPAAAVGLLIGLWALRGRWGRGPLTAALLFGGTLFPALGFISVYPFRFSFVADHFQYLAMLAPIALVAAVATRTVRRREIGAATYLTLAAAAALVLGGLTWRQCFDYRDLETLYLRTIEKNPAAAIAHGNLGQLRFNQGRVAEAVVLMERAVAIDPGLYESWLNLGIAYERRDDWRRVSDAFEKAYALAPHDTVSHIRALVGCGKASWQLGDVGVARDYFGKAAELLKQERETYVYSDHWRAPECEALAYLSEIEAARGDDDASQRLRARADAAAVEHPALKPQLAQVWFELGKADRAVALWDEVLRAAPDRNVHCADAGRAALRAGQVEKGVELLRAAVRHEPSEPSVHSNLGIALMTLNRPSEALPQFVEATRLDPEDDRLLANLGLAYSLSGDPARAADAFRRVLRAVPGDLAVKRDLAWLLATSTIAGPETAAEALRLAEECCRDTGFQQPQMLDALAAAYALNGRFTEAAEANDRAVALLRTPGAPAEQLEAVRARGELYRRKLPFREGDGAR